jgi:hypothetical protein
MRIEMTFYSLGAGLALIPSKQTCKDMIRKFIFSHLSMHRQISYLKGKGIGLGTRLKDGRKIHLYMLNDLFVEVMYKNDNVDDAPEKVNLISGLMNLNKYLEKDFRASF